MFLKIAKHTSYIAVAFTAWLLSVYAATTIYGSRHSTRYITEIEPVSIAVVLGTTPRATGGADNAYFIHRMNAAADLYHAEKVHRIVVSGDARSPDYDEPKAMRQALEDLGVPAEAITEDERGIRTLDSVLRMYYTFGQDRFTIVSQGFHLNRALMIAAGQGINAQGFQANDPANIIARIRMFVRELFARQKMVYDIIVDTEIDYK